jgi:glycosyltransferase involved in cell wall biosynthesis
MAFQAYRAVRCRNSPFSTAITYTFFVRKSAFAMPRITALLHTHDDALRLGRALETLRPCDQIVIVDRGSRDATPRIAREYGARVVLSEEAATPASWLQSVTSDWILCLDPREALTESLEATLLEWKTVREITAPAFSVFLREETARGWLDLPQPHTRLVPRRWNRWQHGLPLSDPSAVVLVGELLRFVRP